jgi:hypothetical protein
MEEWIVKICSKIGGLEDEAETIFQGWKAALFILGE